MGTFGERLQREREMRGITLEEIAEATKIGTRSLRALEEQDFDKLPGGIFNKGFVRAYSKYLGIDEDQAVADYQTAVNDAQSSGKLTRPESALPKSEESEETAEPVRIPWGLLILIALIVVVGFAAKSYYAQHGWAKLRREPSPTTKPAQTAPTPATPVQQPAVATTATAQTPTVPAADTTQNVVAPPVDSGANQPPAPDPASNSSAPADGFVVKVRAKEKSWVWIKADGNIVFQETMAANSDHVVRAGKQVIVVTGNAGGIELSQNDKLLPSIGQEGEKKTVVLTAQGMQQH